MFVRVLLGQLQCPIYMYICILSPSSPVDSSWHSCGDSSLQCSYSFLHGPVGPYPAYYHYSQQHCRYSYKCYKDISDRVAWQLLHRNFCATTSTILIHFIGIVASCIVYAHNNIIMHVKWPICYNSIVYAANNSPICKCMEWRHAGWSHSKSCSLMHQVEVEVLEINSRTYELEFVVVFSFMLPLSQSSSRGIDDPLLFPYSIIARPLVAKYNSRKILNTVTCETVAIQLKIYYMS